MKLAKEFGRADWRNFIDGLSRAELFEWLTFFELEGFTDDRSDMRFAHNLATTVAHFSGSVEPGDFLYMNQVYKLKDDAGPSIEATKANIRKAFGA